MMDKKTYYKSNGKILMIPPEDIVPNPHQPRKFFDQGKLFELAQSIEENGVIHPICIVFVDGKPVLISGERRLKASMLAGLDTVPCIAMKADEKQSALLTLVENLQREDMNFFEEAEGYNKLISTFQFTQEEISRKIGRAQSTIANKLRLLRLSENEQEKIIVASLTERHARALLKFDDEELRCAALDRIIRDKLNVAKSEKLIDDWINGKIKRKKVIPLIRDVRLFLNTVNHAISTMQKSGIDAVSERIETDEYIEYTIRIPKEEVDRSPKEDAEHTENAEAKQKHGSA